MVRNVNQQSIAFIGCDKSARIDAVYQNSAASEAIWVHNTIAYVELVSPVSCNDEGQRDPGHRKK